MRLLTALLFLLALLPLKTCGASADFLEISKRPMNPDYPDGAQAVDLRAKVDSVTITGFEANRGHCINSNLYPPVQLEFGQRFPVALYCNPVEVKVETDHGNLSVSWDK